MMGQAPPQEAIPIENQPPSSSPIRPPVSSSRSLSQPSTTRYGYFSTPDDDVYDVFNALLNESVPPRNTENAKIDAKSKTGDDFYNSGNFQSSIRS